MDEHPLFKQRAAAYILDRVCPGGVFCFYRLDEPNPHDTYYALAALQLLGVPFDDGGSTVRWLCRVQAGQRRIRLAAAGVFCPPQPEAAGKSAAARPG